MTTIVKLRGLHMRAGPEDIRTFFKDLYIPEGGVYIVGGSSREAFIAFTNRSDGERAICRSGKFIQGSKVTLHNSCLAELEYKLVHKLKRNNMQRRSSPQKRPSHVDTETAFLLGVCTVLQNILPNQQDHNEHEPHVDSQPNDNPPVSTHEEVVPSTSCYVQLFGPPANVTENDLCDFFTGLKVEEAIVNFKWGHSRTCVVKFANSQHANEALCFSHQPLGSTCVEVRSATEEIWNSACAECENVCNLQLSGCRQRPSDDSQNKEVVNKSQTKRSSVDCFPSQSEQKLRSEQISTTAMPEYILMVSNLPSHYTKTEIKNVCTRSNIKHSKILHLLDKKSQRTDKAFLIFDNEVDYEYTMRLDGSNVGHNIIHVSPVSREEMKMKMLKSRGHKSKKLESRGVVRLNEPHGEVQGKEALTCLFVRNMPANVLKGQIVQVFSWYEVREDDISLLCDNNGYSTGEAIVQFQSEKLAEQARWLHGQTYLGSKLLLTPINVRQMTDILTGN